MTDRLSTGVAGLDEILHGGLLPSQSYLIRGPPGAGKSLVGLEFLTAESPDGSLFINMGEREADVRANAASFGFDLDEISILDLSPDDETFIQEETYSIFPASEVEGSSLAERIVTAIDDVGPDRVVVDPVTQLRYLAPDAHQFRQQILSFLRYVKSRDATILFTSQHSKTSSDDDLQFMSDGIIHLEKGEVRTIDIEKFRGSDFDSGPHTARITDSGMTVSPKIRPRNHEQSFTAEGIPSGVPEFDELLNGGIDRGTVTLISGPTGVGKTTTGIQFMKEAAGRGERSVVFSFEESKSTLLHRSESINVPMQSMLDAGTLTIEELGSRDRSVDEFTEQIRHEVEEQGASIVMLDAIDGFRTGLAGSDRDIQTELHDIGRYLRNMGVTTIMVNEVGAITGEFQVSEENISYLGDTIIFLRYIEVAGEMHKAIGILKKRTGRFERTLRRLEITEHGLKVGEPLSGLRGILTGTPELADDSTERTHGGE